MLRSFYFVAFILLAGVLSGCNHTDVAGKQSTAINKSANGSFSVISLDNTTITAARTLTDAFQKTAPRYGMTFYKGTAPKTNFYLRGYFSVLADEDPSDNAILYVFDILNKSGVRLHRIQGKYVLNHTITDIPEGFWGFVNTDGYNAIAADIFKQLDLWLKKNGTAAAG